MKRFAFPMALLLVLTLAACAPAQSQTSSPVLSSGSERTSVSTPAPDATAGFSLEDAQEKFIDAHPNATISVAKKEGDAYYIEGWDGNILYKMKFSIADGKVLLDKTIETGRQN